MVLFEGERDRATLLAVEGGEPFDPMGGRPMREYAVVPADWLEGGAGQQLRAWVDLAGGPAVTLQPKPARRPKSARCAVGPEPLRAEGPIGTRQLGSGAAGERRRRARRGCHTGRGRRFTAAPPGRREPEPAAARRESAPGTALETVPVMHSSVAFAGLILLAGGCGTFVTATPLNSPPRRMSPTTAEFVRVYSSGPPERPHVDVALLDVEQTDGLNEQGKGLMVRRLREKAAAMGCDGVVLGGTSRTDGAPHGTALYLVDPGSTMLHATCIVFKPEPRVARRPDAARPEVPASPAAPAPAQQQAEDLDDPAMRWERPQTGRNISATKP